MSDVVGAAPQSSHVEDDPPAGHSWYGWVVGGVALSTALAMWAVGTPSDASIDPYFFGEMGRSIAHGHAFEGFGSLITRRAPLYPLTLGGVFFVFGDHDRIALLLHCLLFAGTALLAFDMGRRYFNPRTGLIAGLLCAFHPLLLRYVPSLHLETQLTFLVTLMIWCTLRFYYRRTVVNGALVGAVAALAALTKAVVMVYPLVFIVAILLAVRVARRRGEPSPIPWGSFAAMLVTLAVVISPWTIRNYGTTRHIVPISSGTSDAFLRGLIFSRTEFVTLQDPPYTVAENESNAYFRRLAEEAGTVWEADDYETDEILNDEMWRVIREEPQEVVRKSFVGLFAFWYQLTSLKNSVLILVCAIGAWALAIVGWRRARRESTVVWPLLLPAFYLNIILALLLALGRYSAPILPALLVVSAFGVDTLVDRWRQRAA
jgi:4-amino-4-deoxy-L-arabinose transferase-like glycosyltransferase